MKRPLPPVLLTSCIHVADPGSVNLINPEERIHHTMESVEKWLHAFPAIRLVICDSSNYDFTPLVKSSFPSASIECLAFGANKDLVKFHGKGYGEGEIVRYALDHSIRLKETDFFAKCTAKLWVENFAECLEQWNGTFLCKMTFTNAFSLKATRIDHVDTRFYLAEKSFYKRYFMNAHMQLGHTIGMSIEDSFRDIILQNQMQGIVFRTPPMIGGVGGGTGKYYNISPVKKLKEYLRYWLLRLSPRWKPLFSQMQ